VVKAISKKHFAVIGAGWAGCSAAVELVKAGHQVSLFEAARQLGGRARAVPLHGLELDNGQHILLGAYQGCLALMQELGIAEQDALLRLPLQMCYPNPTLDHGMEFIAPHLPAPLHLLIALLKAKGLDNDDKLALARFSTTARWMGWRLHQDCSVIELLERFDQTPRLCRLMWIPLCIAALNTPPDRASAQVFLNVLRDSLGARRAASDMLIPKLDLSNIIPNTVAQFLTRHQSQVHLASAVTSLRPLDSQWRIEVHDEPLEPLFDGVVLATHPEHARQILAKSELLEKTELANATFTYEAITTCYLQYTPELRLQRPFYALLDHPAENRWGQFVFDRGYLQTDQAGVLAVVISSASAALERSHDQIAHEISVQLAHELKLPQLAQATWHKIITEKRATFACSPNLTRPSNQTQLASLVLAGDYTASDYPATLETAVMSGKDAAKALVNIV
jgi:squalene-associated FAD-dependent desaturase